MKDIAVLMPCWKSPELLRVSAPSILKSLTTDSELIVILNESDDESISILDELGVKHIDKDSNFGPSAVDFAIPYIKESGFKYVANVNSDMIFMDGWDRGVINLLENRSPCSVSLMLIEPNSECHPPVRLRDSINFFDDNSHDIFNKNIKIGKYISEEMIGCNHPIVVKTEDFLKINGYSDNMDNNWISVCGNSLDPYFAWRLYNMNKDFKFIRSADIFVYHNTSYNRVKFNLVKLSGHQYFQSKTGMSVNTFANMVNINS